MRLVQLCFPQFQLPTAALLFLSFLVFSEVSVTAASTTNILFQPPPDWVQMAEGNTRPALQTNESSEGVYHLLYERQQHAGRRETFERTLSLMQNETGVQDSGNLAFSFDPSYQQLILHRIRIYRGNQILERLDRTKIKTIQPEPQLGDHLFTGAQQAVCFVEDLRVGDRLEHAYTIRGANPILGDHYSSRFAVQSGVPIQRRHVRIIWPFERDIWFPGGQVLAQAQGSISGQTRYYLWDFTDLPAIEYEDAMPAGHEIFPYVELSDFDSWGRVVEWALPLYTTAETNLPPALQELVARWTREEITEEGRTRRALQFIQDELRYTGLELGPDSYRPASPFETFERRFGDCKGKTLLFCTVLRAMGIEAWPALVNTYSREAIARRLPSPFAFNHVIAKVRQANRTLWLDPTISHQGGALSERELPHLHKALVIQAGVQSLEDIDIPLASTLRVSHRTVSTFSPRDYQSAVPFTVTTTYQGSGADNMRETLARSDQRDLLKDYLNFYARFYPGIQNGTPLEITDDRARNIITVTERYEITNFWVLNEARQRREASLHADGLYNLLIEPKTRFRTTPIALAFPLRREQEIVVHLPDTNWKIPDHTEEVNHPAFQFRYRRKLAGSTVRFHYECETRTREIPAEQVAGYLAKREEMENLLGDSLQHANTAADTGVFARLNWLMVVVAAFGGLTTLLAGAWIWRSTRTPKTMPPLLPDEAKLVGIGGWLVLVAIGLCIAPFSRLIQIGPNWRSYFDVDVWQIVAMPGGAQYHALYGPMLIFEMLGNIVLVGLNVLAIFLLFGKRRLFPQAYIALVLGNALFLWADEFLGSFIPSVAESASPREKKAIVQATFWAVIWSCYMLNSKRVKATFREVQKPTEPPLLPDLPAEPPPPDPLVEP